MASFQKTIKTKRIYRSVSGSQIAELPPALLFLLILILFPLIDLLYICSAYGAGWYLNQIEARQVACMPPQAASGKFLINNLPQSLNWNGLMGVVESTEASPSVTYIPVPGSTTQAGQATVVTTVTVQPFLSIQTQWLPIVPGLNGPLTFVYTNTIFQEEQTPAAPVP